VRGFEDARGARAREYTDTRGAEAAARLRDRGAEPVLLERELRESMDAAVVRLEAAPDPHVLEPRHLAHPGIEAGSLERAGRKP
jgi:hypothetical protein